MNPQIKEVDINLIDTPNPADMVYDKRGIQIYKADGATIMIKVIGTSPLKFIALYMDTANLTNKQAIDKLEKVIK